MATNKRVSNKKRMKDIPLLEERIKELQSIERQYKELIERIEYENKKAESGTDDYYQGRYALSRELIKLTKRNS